jgi:phage head maturation protease
MSETNRPTAGEVEERTAGASADGRRVHGLVPYGVKASLGRFTEEIAPGALRDTKLDGLVAVIDHEDRGLPLARYPPEPPSRASRRRARLELRAAKGARGCG